MRDDELLEPILEDVDVAGDGDMGPLEPRGSRRRGGRGLALVAVIGLVGAGLGSIAGWRLGESAGREGAAAAAVRAAAGEGSGGSVTTLPPPPPPPSPPTTVPVPSPPMYGSVGVGQGGTGSGAFGPLELVDRRVTSEGVTVRSYWPVDDGCYPGEWCPPPECRSRSSLVVGLSTDAMVASGGGFRLPALLAPGLYVGGWSQVGVAEEDPVLWVVAHVPEGAATAELLVKGVRRDRAAAERQWAALAVRHELRTTMVESTHDAGSSYEVRETSAIEVVARDEAGRVVGRTSLDSMEVGDQLLPARCDRPGPPLAPPGEQPADPEAARAAVRAAYEQAWNHTSTRGQKLAAIHDTRGVESAMERAAAAYGTAVGSTVVEVGEIVFTSPVQAQLHFRLNYAGAPGLGNRLGSAVLVDGRWLVTRATYCEILSIAGAACGPA
jgi:hypothetical protein